MEATHPFRPTETVEKRKLFLYSLPIYVLILLILLDALIAPLLESRRLAVSEAFYAALKPLCHQWPTRCFWVFGSNLALCTRCTGFFLAFLLTGLFFGLKALRRVYWKTAILLMLPALVDGYTQLRGWRASNNFLRFATGLLAGVGAGALFFPVYLMLATGFVLMLKKKPAPAEESSP